MREICQAASDLLNQLKNDNVDLDRQFAELANLRELVRQKEASFQAKRASRERAMTKLPTKTVDPCRHRRQNAEATSDLASKA
jgi:hypothetical protein